MSKIPPVRRLVTEDFQDQKKWIGKLFQPLNNFMESVVSVLNKGVTIKDNVAGDVKIVTLSSVPSVAVPFAISWSLQQAPIALLVANVVRVDGATFVLSAAVQVQWVFGTSGLHLTNAVGITPSSANQYSLTLIAFTG